MLLLLNFGMHRHLFKNLVNTDFKEIESELENEDSREMTTVRENWPNITGKYL